MQLRVELSKSKDLVKRLNSLDNVIELYQVLGEYNMIAKLIVPDLEGAEKVINQLGTIDGVLDTKTLVVLSELKKSKALPMQSLQKTL